MAIVIIALLALTLVFGFFFASYSMSVRRQTLEEARAWQADHYDISWYDELEKQDYTVASVDGYVLHVQLLRNPTPTRRYILVSHGYTDNRFGSLKYARMYLELGFNVIVYDLRGHGENEPAFCTYSARERKDLLALTEDSRKRYGDADLFGLHGESLGAATSIAVLAYQPEVDFVVADCGFSNIRDVLAGGMKQSHLPGFLVDVASLCAKIRYGYGYRDMRPIDSLADNQIPILFIHGAEDRFIPPDTQPKHESGDAGLQRGASHCGRRACGIDPRQPGRIQEAGGGVPGKNCIDRIVVREAIGVEPPIASSASFSERTG